MGYHLDFAAIPLYAIAVTIAVFLVIQPTVYASSPVSSCTPGTYSVTCTKTLQFSTPFPGGGGGTFVPGQAANSIVPLTSNVISYNNGNSQWLITCPNKPNTQDELEYIVFGGNIGGNACQASGSDLVTTATLILSIGWSPTSLASASATLGFANAGELNINNLAYSGEAYNSSRGIGSANVSSGYNSRSNAFSGVPPSPQGGIWTWNARIADFSPVAGLSESDTLSGLSYNAIGTDSNGNQYSCLYTYGFSAAAKITGISNSNIIVPARQLPSDNYITFNNQTYNSVKQGTPSGVLPTGVSANAVAMYECYLPNLFGGWHLVGTNGMMDINQQQYNSLCIYQYSDSPYYFTGFLPGHSQDVHSAQVAYAPSTASSYESAYLLPVLYYNSSVPAAYSSPSTQLSFVNSSYYVYSQHNLQSPGNYIDPVTLHGASGIFLNTNGVLASLSTDSFYGGNYYATSTSPPGLNLQSNYVLATSSTALSNASQVSSGYWAGSIANPMFVSESANNNLFVVAQSSGKYYLYRLQLIPQGQLNLTANPPSSIAGESSIQQQAYWNSVEQLQSYPVYLASVTQLPEIKSTSNGMPGNGPPLALASDYAGDAFVVSANYSTSGTNSGGLGFVLTYISANGIVSQQWITSTPASLGQNIGGYFACSGLSCFGPPQTQYCSGGTSDYCQYPLSIAVSPTGQYLYMSDPATPYVYIYSISLTSSTPSPGTGGSSAPPGTVAPTLTMTPNPVTLGQNVVITATCNSIADNCEVDYPSLGTPMQVTYPSATTCTYDPHIGPGGGGADYIATCTFDTSALPGASTYTFYASTTAGPDMNAWASGNLIVRAGPPQYTIGATYLTAINLSYSTSTYNMSIGEYLANGGPFDSNGIEDWVKNYPDTNCNHPDQPGLNYYNDSQEAPGNVCYDGGVFHVPLDLAVSGSTLYVLDNWLFDPQYSKSLIKEAASMLMLRAFYLNGTEIPIHASTVDDVIPKTQGLALTTGYIANKLYPPYGWPISANFSTYTSSSGQQYISYCAYYCNNTPMSQPPQANLFSVGSGPYGTIYTPDAYGGYPPIGPGVAADNPVPGASYAPYYSPSPISLTSDFNNTVYLDMWSLFEPQQYPHLCHIAGTGVRKHQDYYDACQLYTELLAVHMNVDNYTKASNASASPPYGCYHYTGANSQYFDQHCGYLNSNYNPNNGIAFSPSSYTCYIGVNQTTWRELNKGTFSNSQSSYSYKSMLQNPASCTFVDNLSLQRPPFIGMPDPFAYAESEGSPLNYMVIPDLVSQYIPPGGDPPDPPLAAGQITPQSPVIASGQNVILTANPSGGTQPYTYQWYTSSGVGTCSNSSSKISGATASTYKAFPTKTTNYCYIVADSSPSTANSPTDTVTVYTQKITPPTVSFSPSPYVTVGTNVIITASCKSGDTCAILNSNMDQIANAVTVISTYVLSCMNGGTYNSVLGYCSNGQADTVYTSSLTTGNYIFYAEDTNTGAESQGSTLYVGGQIPPPPVPTQQLIQTYLRGTAGGYVLIPYTYTQSLTTNYLDGALSSFSGPSADQSLCGAAPSGASTHTSTYNTAILVNADSVLKEQLQGGALIAQYQNSKNLYTANLSDQNLIMPPEIFFNVFTNRILGEIFINQTVGPGGFSRYAQPGSSGSYASFVSIGGGGGGGGGLPLMPLPLVFNAIHLLNYSQTVFTQYSTKYGNKPGYSAEAALGPPLNPITQHKNAASSVNASWQIEYTSSMILNGPVFADGITIDPGVSITTDGYPMVALDYITAGSNSRIVGGYASDGGLYGASGLSLTSSYGGSGGGGAQIGVYGGNTLAPGGGRGMAGTSNALPSQVTSQQVASFGTSIVTYLTGAGGASGSYGSAGGDSSFGVYLQANQLELSGATINTAGQAGGPGSGGGGGGVILLTHGPSFQAPSYIDAGGLGGGSGGANGGPGNVLIFNMMPPGNVPIRLAQLNSLPLTGAACASIGCNNVPNYYYNLGNSQPAKQQCPFSSIYCGNSIFGYSAQLGATSTLQLFSALDVYVNEFMPTIDLTYNKALQGYNRVNYTFADEFNNTINMPLDADLASITSIVLNAQTTVNDINPNETAVTISGTAGYYPNAYTATPSPVPTNSPIYIYYDTNMNFYTTNDLIATDPNAYYAYAEQCAFGTGAQCSFASPVLTTSPPTGQGPLGPREANVINFNTQYNSITGGSCAMPPNSLLLPTSTNTKECNIYPGNPFELPQTGTSAYGKPEYCIPYYQNGNGVLTSQLGLVAIVPTAAGTGAFSDTFNICGTGTARVQVSYYGYPPGQPQTFLQQPISQGTLARPITVATAYSTEYTNGNVVDLYYIPNCGSGAPCTIASYEPMLATSEFNYSISPNSTVVSFPIGSYLLSFGDITAWIALAAAVAFVSYALLRGLLPTKS